MRDSTLPCGHYRTYCTDPSAPIRLIPFGFQIITELVPPGVQILIASIPLVLLIRAWVTPSGRGILTELSAHEFQHQLS